jgi:hypothetical protein
MSEGPKSDEKGAEEATGVPGEEANSDRVEDRLFDRSSDRGDRGLSDLVRRAVSAGVGAATRSKDDLMRVAASEMKTWLEHMDLNSEVVKALSRMVIEIKTEIRFRPDEDGKLAPEASNDVKVTKPAKG